MRAAAAPHPRFFMPYAAAARLQETLLARRIDDAAPDTLLLVEHEPVVTLGSSTAPAHLRLGRDEFARRGIAVVPATRGGSATYHGPGQLVAYPIVKLADGERDAHAYIHRLEDAVMRTLARFGIDSFRVEGKSGAWTSAGKIAAVGVFLKRWVTCHGLALNVDPDLDGFATIVPCGLTDTRVATMARLLAPAPAPPLDDVADALVETMRAVFARTFDVVRGGTAAPARAGA
jgi:lipoyl(octanoyl) transferase